MFSCKQKETRKIEILEQKPTTELKVKTNKKTRIDTSNTSKKNNYSRIDEVEKIIFDLNNDNNLDTITLYKYYPKDYKENQFQSIRIKLANSSEFYSNLPEPFGLFNNELLNKYSLIDSRRVLITEIDSSLYIMISSKTIKNKIGYLNIYNTFKDIINFSLNERISLDSIVSINNKYYDNALFAKKYLNKTSELKTVIYPIPHSKYEDPIRYSKSLTDKLLKTE